MYISAHTIGIMGRSINRGKQRDRVVTIIFSGTGYLLPINHESVGNRVHIHQVIDCSKILCLIDSDIVKLFVLVGQGGFIEQLCFGGIVFR